MTDTEIVALECGTRVSFAIKRSNNRPMRQGEGLVRTVWEYDGHPVVDVDNGDHTVSVIPHFGDKLEVISQMPKVSTHIKTQTTRTILFTELEVLSALAVVYGSLGPEDVEHSHIVFQEPVPGGQRHTWSELTRDGYEVKVVVERTTQEQS